MLFDRQLLYLAFLFGTQRAFGRAIDLSKALDESSSVSLNPSASSSAHRVLVQATQSSSFLRSVSSSSAPSLSDISCKNSHSHHDTPISSNSASKIDWPSLPSNQAVHSVLDLVQSDLPILSEIAASHVLASASPLFSVLAQATEGSSTPAITPGAPYDFHHNLSRNTINVNSTSARSSNAQNVSGSVQQGTSGNAAANTTTAANMGSTAASSPSPTSGNVLSDIFDALPSSIGDALQSEFNDLTSELFNTQTTMTPMRPHTSRSFTNSSRAMTSSPTSTPTTTPTTSSSPTTSHTTMATHTTLPTPSPTNDRQPVGANPIKEASVIGLSAGLVAGAVLIGLGGVYLWRRKRQGKPMFARSGSQRSAGGPYPQVAWLYDPVITPSGSPGHSRQGSEAGILTAEQRGVAMEMQEGVARPSHPLLAPPRSRDPSPGGSPYNSSGEGSRDLSMDNDRRPLRGIDEEGGA